MLALLSLGACMAGSALDAAPNAKCDAASIAAKPVRQIEMQIDRIGDMQAQKGPADYFTGDAYISRSYELEAPSRVTGATVTFLPGARTNWHKHPLGQTLIVTDGVGWTQVRGGEVTVIEAGDIIWCPPDTEHWHGATPEGIMTHAVVQEKLNGSNVEWLEPVTDEQYRHGAD